MDEQEVTWENQVGKDGTDRLSGGLHVPCMRDVTESVESGDRVSEGTQFAGIGEILEHQSWNK